MERLRYPFRNVDSMDWAHLDDMLDYGGHGRFWRNVLLEEMCAALAAPTASGGEQKET